MEITVEKRTVCVLFFMFSSLICNSQCLIKTDTLAYINDTTCVLEHSIINNTKDTFYLWIDELSREEDSVFRNIENVYFLKYLFFSPCELGLYFKGTDCCIHIPDKPIPLIGCDFIKRIVPKDTFFIMTSGFIDIKKRVFFVSKEILRRRISLYNIEPFLYRKRHIYIPDLPFQKKESKTY